MAKVVGDIAVSVGADVSGLEAGMKRGGRAVRGFEKDSADMAARMTKISKVVVSASLAMGAGFIAATRRATDYAKEITTLSNLAGVGAEEFQKLAYAGETVGFSGEKMADIFKDVNDKFGDFLATGAGPLKDFFENIGPKVGVTADQFARLSGPEALQLYVTSLEKAGVSQQQMTFYMEALASDATALIPLLQDSGQAMLDLGDDAESAGVIIEQALIDRGNEMADKWAQILNQMSANVYQFALNSAASLDNLFGITESGKLEQERDKLSNLADERNSLLGQITDERDRATRSVHKNQNNTEIARLEEVLSATEDEMNVVNDSLLRVSKLRQEREDRIAALRKRPEGAGGSSVKPGGRKPSGGGGGKSGPDLDDFKDFSREFIINFKATGLNTIRGNVAKQTKALDAWRDSELGKLRSFRETKVITEQEYNDREKKVLSDHAGALAQLKSQSSGFLGFQVPNIDILRNGLSQQTEALDAWRDSELEKLREFLEAKKITQEEYNEQEAQIQAQHAEAQASTQGQFGGGDQGGGILGLQFPNIETIQTELALQTEQIDLWREEQLEKLAEFREAKIGTEEEYNAIEAQITADHASALADIESRAQNEKIRAYSGALGDLSSLMQSESDKLFKIGKAAALAQAVVDGYRSAISAWAHGMAAGGPYLAAAFTVASVAKTGALISSIQSASSRGGGGGGGGGGSGAAPAAAPQQSPLALTLEGVNPNDLYSGSTITGLFERLQDEAQDRGFTVSFT